jgi:hypothetical protein
LKTLAQGLEISLCSLFCVVALERIAVYFDSHLEKHLTDKAITKPTKIENKTG